MLSLFWDKSDFYFWRKKKLYLLNKIFKAFKYNPPLSQKRLTAPKEGTDPTEEG